MTNIAACPFCGKYEPGTRVQELKGREANINGMYAVVCTHCCAHGPFSMLKERALIEWNERK